MGVISKGSFRKCIYVSYMKLFQPFTKVAFVGVGSMRSTLYRMICGILLLCSTMATAIHSPYSMRCDSNNAMIYEACRTIFKKLY